MFRATMFWAYVLWREDTIRDRHVLIATHSPVGILASPEPAGTHDLAFADIARYRVMINALGECTILSLEHLRCPPVD